MEVPPTRVAFRQGAALRFAELFLIPVIAATGDFPLCDQRRWVQAAGAVGDALDRWLGLQTRRTAFSGLYPYDWVSSWPAATLREHVLSTVPGRTSQKLTFSTECLALAPDAPGLVFFCMVVRGSRGWPPLPADGEGRFRRVAALALQGPQESAPIVLSPGTPAVAILDGLVCWLQELHDKMQIEAWTVNIVEASSDIVRIILTFQLSDTGQIQFSIRKHQIGADGIGYILRMLADMAPMLDEPIDAPAA